MKIGIIGLPNVGKSSVFNAMTRSSVPAENYQFCTVEPNVGVALVPDPRLDALCAMYDTLSRVPATVEFVDIAGLVKGAGTGEGLGNQFLGHIRSVNAILHVVRCFEDPLVMHVAGRVDPASDVMTVIYELIFADLEILDKRLAGARKQAPAAEETALLERARARLMEGRLLDAGFSDQERERLSSVGLLTSKTMIYAANVPEECAAGGNDLSRRLGEFLASEFGADEPILISARLESEISQLDPAGQAEFLEEMGLERSGLDQLIRRGYGALDLITFFTAGKKECRAWAVTRGTRAASAAGRIHSDIERGFIRAEVTEYGKLVAAGGDTRAKELAYTRIEGRDYVMEDGDVVFFRFNV